MIYKKKVLVTGGAGFIGSHLCETLYNSGFYDVFSLDNYFTGSKNNHIKGVNYIKGNSSNIDKLIDFEPDYIYHLGEYSRVEQSFDDIELVWKSNKDGIFAILEFARKKKAKLIYAGSSTKYGDGGLGRSQSPYAWSKATNTELVKNYGNWFGIKYAITYFYNVYGPREISHGKYATLIALFKEKVRKNEPLTVVRPGTQKRNFTHVNDIVRGLIAVGEHGSGDEYGIGSPEKLSVIEVANLFKSDIVFLPEREGNRLDADLMDLKIKELGWEVEMKLEDYIDEFLKIEYNHKKLRQ